MQGRIVTRAVLISMVAAMLGAGWVPPAVADERDKGNSEAEMTIAVGCHSVEVSSSKDVSNVKVYFTDGTMEEIHVNRPSYSATFEKTIDHATAKSGTTEIGDSAGDCGGAQNGGGGDDDTCCANGNGGGGGGNGGGGDTGGGNGGGGNGNGGGSNGGDGQTTATGGGDDGDGQTTTGGDQPSTGGDQPSTGGGGQATTGGGGDQTTTAGSDADVASGADTTTGDAAEGTTGDTTDAGITSGAQACPAGTDHAGELMADLADCNEADVLGSTGIDTSALVCPSGPYEGMPFMKPSDCGSGRDAVLANRVLRRVQAGALPATGLSAAALIGLALVLMFAGIVTLRGRSVT